ncbi:hypothetical protein HOD96_02170 [Candidatus Falkowbacteria bacterium]|jgi:ribokinase|nr:hypothetical protein [Candidatus Falkowbacteria bacterium]MBT4433097.1 hypothetical protein [Candidatus Falkowbacteria bacterium]
MFDIITIGGATKDFFILTNKGEIVRNKKSLTKQKLLAFEYGAKIYTNELYTCLGGGACNTAVGFSRLGLKIAAKICVNEQLEGEWIKKVLIKEKVSVKYIKNNTKEPSGFSSIVINSDSKSRDHIAFCCRGTNKFLKINPRESWKTKWIYLSSFSGKEWVLQFKNIVKIVKKKNIKLAFNPGFRQIESGINKLKDILKLTEVLIVNRDEAIELVLSKHHYNQAPHIKELLSKLYKYCPNLIIITDGSRGVYAYDGKEFYFEKAKKVKAVDTTGAGDAFSSGFIGGLVKNGDIKKSLKLGIKNGGSVVTKMGAQKGLIRNL